MIMFPSRRYHRTEKPRIVNSQAESDALGPDWADTPAAFAQPEEDPAPADQPELPVKRGRGRPPKQQ